MTHNAFEHLIRDALAQDFSGWDFSWLEGRWLEEEPAWDYRARVEQLVGSAGSLLDMGTGGGEFLASLRNRPARTFATEGYRPNLPVAAARLAPLGVLVVPLADDSRLPFRSQAFDLVINRHESYDCAEVIRILKPGGIFLTQQVGARDCIALNQFLGAPVEEDAASWTIVQELGALSAAGFEILDWQEQYIESVFFDIGAVVYYLKVISWQIADFSVKKYRPALLRLHEHIQREGAFRTHGHRFLIEARS